MKKKIAIAVVVAGLGLAGLTQAYAGWGMRGGGYGGYAGNCPQATGQAFNQVDPAVQEKLDKFFTDTQELRKQMMVKQSERMALMRSDNPDPAAAGKIAGELFDLRTQMHEKAEAAGVSEYLGPMAGGGFGPGMGWGGMHGGRGGRFMNGPMMGGPNF